MRVGDSLFLYLRLVLINAFCNVCPFEEEPPKHYANQNIKRNG